MEIQRNVVLMIYLISIIFSLESYWVEGVSQVPCYFIFGDSLVDNGNNNNNKGVARADYKPYGIDFSKDMTPTGRFTNGRNIADFIAELLGFTQYIPPFKNTAGSNIVNGVNYASGAAGIRDETGMTQGERSSLNKQLTQHTYTISQIQGSLGSSTTAHLNKCLYMVNIGGNDYLNNYFMPNSYKTSLQYTPEQYAIALNQQITTQLKTLYGQGARRFAIFGAGLVGCTPYALSAFDRKGAACVDQINSAVLLFNAGLKSAVQNLNANFADAKFTFIDTVNMALHPTFNPGAIVQDKPCCALRPDGIQCAPLGNVCPNRNGYIFWDGVHPTEIGMKTLATRAFNAQNPNDAYPYDISHLITL